MVSSGNRALSPWWQFYHIYKDQASVQELDADKLFACCNLCGKNIAAGNKAGKGGIKRHIKGQHPGQLKFMDAKHGGTLGVDIDSTIKKRKTRDGDLATMWTNSSLSMAERKEKQLESTSLFLAMANVPTDVIESKYFKAMLKSFDANADPPSINKVKDHFRILEENIRQAQLVTTTGGYVTITCDHWTSVAKQGNNQKVQVGKIMWNGEYLCVKELSRTIKQ